MKVLIAYDGSESADTAIDGLRRAGLPIHVRSKSSACEMEVFEYVSSRNKTASRC